MMRMMTYTVAINAVDAVPPKESCNSLVNLLSRYGMCVALFSANAAMTLPNADNDVLMLLASDSLVPLLIVRLTRSDPARSTINNFDRMFLVNLVP